MPKPREPDLFAWAPKNPDKVLPAGSPIFDGKFVPELTKTTADEVSAVVIVPPIPTPQPTIESPLADENDGVARYLREILGEYEEE